MRISKKQWRRGISLFLALTMCLSMLQLTALAVEDDYAFAANHEHNSEGWICTPFCSLPEHTHTDACYAVTENDEAARTPVTLPDEIEVNDGTSTERDDFGNEYTTPEFITWPSGEGEDDTGDDSGTVTQPSGDGEQHLPSTQPADGDEQHLPTTQPAGEGEQHEPSTQPADEGEQHLPTTQPADEGEQHEPSTQPAGEDEQHEPSAQPEPQQNGVDIPETDPPLAEVPEKELQCGMEEHKHTEACAKKDDGGWYCVPDTDIKINVPEESFAVGRVDLLKDVTATPGYCGNWKVMIAVASVTVKDSADAAEVTELEPEDGQWLEVEDGKFYTVTYAAYLDTSMTLDAETEAQGQEVPDIGSVLGTWNMTGKTIDGVARVGNTGYDSLQLAIRNAESGETVVLLQDVTESVLLPASGTVLDLGGHTLTGDGKAAVSIKGLRAAGDITIQNGTIAGAEGYRALTASNVNLTLENVTMKPSGSLLEEDMQSSNFGGGCIYMDKGTLTVNKGTFTGDAGTYKESASNMGAGRFREVAAYGSHIFAGASVTDVNITNSTFSDSKSKFGAVYAANANVTVTDSTFTNNGNGLQLDNKNGVFNISNSTFTGGTKAINASGGSKMTLNITNSTFSGFEGKDCVVNANGSTNITGGSFSDNNMTGSGVVQTSGVLVMDGTELTNNTSYGVIKPSSDTTMRNVTATGNTGISSMYSGGTVLNANSIKGKTVILDNVTATGNEQTKEHGGAFYLGGSSNDTSTVIEIKNCTLTGNTAKSGGGAIYLNNKGTTTITDTVITRNTANGTGKYAGGGIQVGSTSGTVTLAGSTRVYNNETPKVTVKHLTVGATADIALTSNYSSKSDFTSEDAVQRATLVLNNETTFIGDNGNKYTLVKSDAKGLHYSSGSSSSKKFYWPVGYYTTVEEPARVFVNAPTGSHTGTKDVMVTSLTDAVAKAKEEGVPTVYICGNVNVTAADAAALNSGITFTRCADHPNGHMFTINGNVTLNGAHINGNKVDGDSAMIYVPSSGHLTIAGTTLIENGKNAASRGNGGAVYVSQGALTMTGGTIDNNSAYQGGGIYAYSSLNGNKIVFEGGKVSNNTATGGNGGGGAYIGATSSEFGVNGGRTYFENNIANQLGGGVFLVNGTNAKTHHYIYKATFTGNKSYRSMQYFDGGAIYIQSGTTAHMKNVYVSGNTDSDSALAHNNYTAVAVCPIGELAVYELDGLLAVNNNGKVDIGVVVGGTIPKVDPMVYLPSYAPGGGDVSYVYSNGTKVDLSDHQFTKGYFRVKTQASQSAIDAAKETAETDGVVITGNYATQFGAGIMTNGILKIGTETTTLRVNKVWTDGNENHKDDQILVYLTKDGEIVDKDFRSDSSVILSAENDWSYTWTNLGNQFTWGVKEAAGSGYSSEVKVEKDTEFSAIADKYYIATITNTPGQTDSEKLVITKTAIDLNPENEYNFTLKLGNLSDGEAYALNVNGKLIPIYNGEVKFTLKDGESAVVEGLPAGFTYDVTEEESPEYRTFVYESMTADVDGSIKNVMVVNKGTADLTVKKVVESDAEADHTKEFAFKVSLFDKDGNPYNVMNSSKDEIDFMGNMAEFAYELYTGDEEKPVEGSLSFAEGIAQFNLKDNQTIVIKDLPLNITAHVEELEESRAGFWTMIDHNGEPMQNHEIGVQTGTGIDHFVTFTNHRYEPGKLPIPFAKSVVGETTETPEFKFTLTEGEQNDKTGYKLPENLTVTLKNVTSAASGSGQFNIEFTKAGEYTFIITEDTSGAGENWKYDDAKWTVKVRVTASEDKDGKNILKADIVEKSKDDAVQESDTFIEFTNTYTKPEPKLGSLTVIKAINGGGSEAQSKVYSFTVTGPDGYSETFTITGAGSHTLNNLKPGTYTVTEDRDSAVIGGYYLNVTGSGSTAEVKAGETASVTVTNTYTTPSGGGDPDPDPDPDNPPPPPPPPTPDTPIEPNPTPLTELPDPNDPESPEEVTVIEEDVPKTYIKTWDPEEEEYVYVPEDDVPLGSAVPKTGDSVGAWAVLCLTSAAGLGVLTLTKPRKKEEAE